MLMHIVIIAIILVILVGTHKKVRGLGKRVVCLEDEVSRLRFFATHDPLTEVFNRRGGMDILNHHISLLSRNNSANKGLAVLILDLDYFKEINDTYGHTIGDMALKFFVAILLSVLRKDHDIVIRTGGDEFCVIAPGCDLAGAKKMREKIKNAFAEKLLSVSNKQSIRISASIGLATSHRGRGGLRDLEQLLELADRVLYAEKRART